MRARKITVITTVINSTTTMSVDEIVLPERADTQRLPKKNDITQTSILLEVRKNHNAMLDVLEILVKEVKDLKKQGLANKTQVSHLAERVIPEVRETLVSNLAKVEDRAIDLQHHGFRLNLIARGKDELDDETHQQTEQLFRDILKEDTKIDNADTILFRDCHRLPKPKRGHGSSQPKPIICAFIRQQDRDLVLSKAHMLKDTGKSLQSHLPKRLNDLRNAMLKERRSMLDADRARRVRVVEKNFTPVIQEYKAVNGSDKWVTIKFEANQENLGNNPPRRSGRRNTVVVE